MHEMQLIDVARSVLMLSMAMVFHTENEIYKETENRIVKCEKQTEYIDIHFLNRILH